MDVKENNMLNIPLCVASIQYNPLIHIQALQSDELIKFFLKSVNFGDYYPISVYKNN